MRTLGGCLPETIDSVSPVMWCGRVAERERERTLGGSLPDELDC